MTHIETTVEAEVPECPRCDRDHGRLAFVPFDVPPDGATHWVDCPELKDPILLFAVFG